MWVARTIPSSADWPVPKRSLKLRSAVDSLTANTGQPRAPEASRPRTRTRPDVVSSIAPSIPGTALGRAPCRAVIRSAPSSIVTAGAARTARGDPDCSAGGHEPRDMGLVGVGLLAVRRQHRHVEVLDQPRRGVVLGRE